MAPQGTTSQSLNSWTVDAPTTDTSTAKMVTNQQAELAPYCCELSWHLTATDCELSWHLTAADLRIELAPHCYRLRIELAPYCHRLRIELAPYCRRLAN